MKTYNLSEFLFFIRQFSNPSERIKPDSLVLNGMDRVKEERQTWKLHTVLIPGQQGRNSRPVRVIIGGQFAA